MAADDHALVIGVQRYPTLGGASPDVPDDLLGPENDVREMAAWLGNEAGVPAANLRIVVSAPGAAGPRLADLRRELDALHAFVSSRPPRSLGRLYLYAAGHGFGRKRNEGGILLADATPEEKAHLYVSSYFDWFVHSGRFREYVLFLDACMNQDRLQTAQHAHYAPRIDGDVGAGRVLTAYAARFNGLAVEAPMPPNGHVHGAFSHALLLGLRGGAAVPSTSPDPSRGKVTVRSLRDYLVNTMRRHMGGQQNVIPNVSEEPDFGEADDFDLVDDVPLFQTVTLRLPPMPAGTPLVLRDGRLGVVARRAYASEIEVEIQPGLYLLEQEGGPFRRAFEAAGDPAPIDLTGEG